MDRIEGTGSPSCSQPPSGCDGSIHRQLLVAFSHSNRAMRARTRREGLKPGQPKVLEHLRSEDGCNQRAIGRACVMDASTVTSVLARMEADGLVERRAVPGDRRGVSVALTPSGREAAERVSGHGDEVDAICLAGFTLEERTQLARLLARVIANLERAEEAE